VQISGLPGNDRPLNHTVILRLARSIILARWRHAFSLKTRGSGGPGSASLPRSRDHMVRCEFLPRGGTPRSVMQRQVQLYWNISAAFENQNIVRSEMFRQDVNFSRDRELFAVAYASRLRVP
jgi:hypothetical protein